MPNAIFSSSIQPFLNIVVFFVVVCSIFSTPSARILPDADISCPPERVSDQNNDKNSLVSFRNRLADHGTPFLADWDLEDLNSWHGVTLREDGRIKEVNLSGLGLKGQIWPFWDEMEFLEVLDLSNNQLSGMLNASTCQRALRVLNLSNNYLSGEIIFSMTSLGTLNSLDLSSNKISGNLPTEISKLVSLRLLNLSSNNINGSLHAEIGHLQSLEVLDLSQNQLTGEIPANISELVSLRVMNLSGNRLNGPLHQNISQLRSLEVLDLAHNSLYGNLWPAISQMTSLKVLRLCGNKLSGNIPSEIGMLRSLVNLDLAANRFLGSIPNSLANCSQLVEIKLSDNQLTGSLPSEFSTLPGLLLVSIGNNALSGQLQFGSLSSQVEVLYLPGNHLSGPIPSELGLLRKLKALILHNNQFEGQIPSELGDCTFLEELWLDSNRLTGSIPDAIFELKNLRMLVLANNSLSGPIPSKLSNCSQLQVLWLEQNTFTGTIPQELYNLRKLLMLSLSNNRLEGTLPRSLGKLQNLVGLDLGFNNFTGVIPDELAGLSSIQFFFLTNNQIEGPVPSWIANFSCLRALDFSVNKFRGSLPMDWVKLDSLVSQYARFPEKPPGAVVYTTDGQKYVGFALPTTLDFSHNNLTGSIPPSLGMLKDLQVLNLSHNFLCEKIPGSLGKVSALLKLDLSNNKLLGNVPTELTQLTFLSVLNLSSNMLVGQIPQSAQFSTFTNSSFLGNPGLCGMPLQACPPASRYVSAHRKGPEVSVMKKLIPLYVVIAGSLGFCAFWAFFLLLIRRRQKLLSTHEEFDKKFNISDGSTFSGSPIVRITPKELAMATDNYSQANIIGDGGFGIVYKAILNNGRLVAVKRLVTDGTQGEREFLSEMHTLGKIKHKNLACLLGYCSDGNDRMLVYKYLKNGSLDTWLHCREEGVKPLDWPTRLKILHGAAQGIWFLHHECFPPIVHRDIKVSNILLDEDFEAHMADFGLARLMHVGDTHVSTDVAGTVGYIPPECNHSCIATTRGDVYSFGVVMLEILTGRRPTDSFFRRSGFGSTMGWIQSLSEEQLSLALDSTLLGTGPIADMIEVLRIACFCCHEKPGKRPDMQEVLWMLETVEKRATYVSPQSPYLESKRRIVNIEGTI